MFSKISSKLSEQLDFKCSDVIYEKTSLENSSKELWKLIQEVCSGSLTWGEVLNESSEIVSC